MKTIAICSSKGGAGKTTLALHLAVAYASSGRATAIIDLDPQASAAEWRDRRAADLPAVMTAPPIRLAKEIERVREAGGEILIIDTPPHNGDAIKAAARAADLVLVPCRPAIMDLNAITTTLGGLDGVPAAAFVVFNATPAKGGYVAAARAAIESEGGVVCPVTLGNRQAFSNALVGGLTATEYEPRGIAAQETLKLYKFTSSFVE